MEPEHTSIDAGATVLPFRRPIVPINEGSNSGNHIAVEHHRIIMRMLLKHFNATEIAETLGLNPSSVRHVIRSDIFRAEMAALQARADERTIDDTAKSVQGWIRRTTREKATKTLEAILDDQKASLKLKADICFDLLDRDGHKAVERKEVTVDYAHIVQVAFERRKAMAALPTPDKPVAFADVPGYVPPEGAADGEPQQFALEGFDTPLPEPTE